MRSFAAAVLVAFLVAAAEPSVAAAEPLAGTGEPPATAPSSAPNLAIAQRRFEEGRRLFDGRAYEPALVELRASYAVYSSPNTRLYIARCHRELGHLSTAALEFKLTAAEAQQRIQAGDRKYLTTRDSAAGEAEELEAKVSRVLVAVPSDVPKDFRLESDGQEIPREAWGVAFPVDAGERVFQASGHRLVPFRRVVRLAEGQTARLDVSLSRVPTALLRATFATRPAGTVLKLDGRPSSFDELAADVELDPGEHALEIQSPGHDPFVWRRTLGDGAREEVAVVLRPTPPPGPKRLAPWVFFTAAGAAAAALGTGVALAVDGDRRATAEKRTDPLLRSASTHRSIQTEQTAANVLLATGAVLAAGSVVVALFTGFRAERPRVAAMADGLRVVF